MTESLSKRNQLRLEGIWVPVVTPFRNGEIDEESFARLLKHLVREGVSGVVVAGTTGESSVLSDDERLQLASLAVARVAGRVPILVGVGGADTRRTIDLARRMEETGADGILSVVPPYNRPDQAGIVRHFEAIASSTSLPVVLYNVPYRTGVNMRNETTRRLAHLDNVVGMKDSSGDFRQSMELLLDPPPAFSILTGEDLFCYSMLLLGASGGILAAAHWETSVFVEMWESASGGGYRRALDLWRRLSRVIPLFFEEPNPVPMKHYLFKAGLIASSEVRLPLVEASDGLKARIDELILANAGR